jgi:hypothetical protein
LGTGRKRRNDGTEEKKETGTDYSREWRREALYIQRSAKGRE